jgi:4-hydroxy 2-oxovalerate aldolase
MSGNINDRLKKGWVGYRPDIKLLDCTVRDGGLMTAHQFEDDFVKGVYNSVAESGVDYVEMGYKASKNIYSPSEHGPWKFCDEDDLRRIVGDKPDSVKISVMADAERTDYKEDILPSDQSVIDTIRVACYIHQVPTAVDMIKDAHDKGYETLLQLMAISVVSEDDMREALEIARETPVTSAYIVDSFGSLYSEDVKKLTKLFLEMLDGTGKEVGFHGHNNQQLGFANTVEALISGASRLDATVCGIGRGAGNCPMELLVGFLHNPKFHLRPILQCAQDYLAPLAREVEWGYTVPYGITGQLNQHPRPAMKLRASDNPDAYVDFYDTIVEEE